MTDKLPIKTLFLDVGGVLLTNGWGRASRQLAAETFNIDYAELDERHHLTFDTFEEGKLTLDEYLAQTVFYEPRSFSKDDLINFMYPRSTPYPEMSSLVTDLKARYKLGIVVVSNEGRELTAYRVKKFGMTDYVDAFIVSSFVHYRKPDMDMYQIALDVSQTAPEQVVYIDDRALFTEVACKLAINCIHHIDVTSTQKALAGHGLSLYLSP